MRRSASRPKPQRNKKHALSMCHARPVPGIHVLSASQTWMAGTSPAMTKASHRNRIGPDRSVKSMPGTFGKRHALVELDRCRTNTLRLGVCRRYYAAFGGGLCCAQQDL